MVDVYTEIKPDSSKSQLQVVLTAYYEDIKGVQGASCCPKIKIVKRLFEDQKDADEDAGSEGEAAAAAAAAAATGRMRGSGCCPRRPGGTCTCCACPQPCRREDGTGCHC